MRLGRRAGRPGRTAGARSGEAAADAHLGVAHPPTMLPDGLPDTSRSLCSGSSILTGRSGHGQPAPATPAVVACPAHSGHAASIAVRAPGHERTVAGVMGRARPAGRGPGLRRRARPRPPCRRPPLTDGRPRRARRRHRAPAGRHVRAEQRLASPGTAGTGSRDPRPAQRWTLRAGARGRARGRPSTTRSASPSTRRRSRVDRLDEAVTILRRLFDGDRVTVDGRHYQLADHRLFPIRHPPLLVGGNGDARPADGRDPGRHRRVHRAGPHTPRRAAPRRGVGPTPRRRQGRRGAGRRRRPARAPGAERPRAPGRDHRGPSRTRSSRWRR